MAEKYNEEHLTKLGQLKMLAEKLKQECATRSELAELSTKVNGITIPENVSAFTNDVKYQKDTEVATAIQEAIAKTGHASFKVVTELPDAETAEANILYLFKNTKTSYYDIYAKVQGDGDPEFVQLDDTSVDLSNYVTNDSLIAKLNEKVDKNGNKQLSTEDFTTELKNKLQGIQDGATKYVHPTSAEGGNLEEKLYKITTDENGHIATGAEVTKIDITALGIPGTDTTYTEATESAPGLMSAADKAKLNSLTVATDEEITAMIGEIFPDAAA